MKRFEVMSLSKLNDNLTGRAALYMAGQLCLKLLQVISVPIFVRLMTTTEYGLASIYLTWVLIFSKIFDLRVDSSIQNAWAEFGDDELPSYVSSCMFLAFCFFLPVFVICFIFCEQLSSIMNMIPWVLLICLITSFAIGCSDIRMAYLTVKRNASANMLVSLALSLLQIICSLILLIVVMDDGYEARVLGYSIPSIAMGALFFIIFYIKGQTLVSSKFWRFCLSLSIPMIFNGLGYLLIDQSDRLMISYMLGPDAAGIYSLAYSCALPISVVANAFGAAWTPEYYTFMKEGDFDSLREHANRYMVNFTLISLGLMLISPEVLILFGTEEYYSGIPILPFIVMAYYFQYLYTWPVNYEFYNKKTKWITAATLLTAALNILLNLFLIPSYGIGGAAFASLISFALLMIMHDFCARRIGNDYIFSWSWYLKGIIPMIVSMAATIFLLDMALPRWSLAITIGIFFCFRVFKSRSVL